MNDKKNLDRLFQEKFKDFEVTPPDFVWQNIEAELEEKKKKRRIIPLWFRLSGVAAILIMGMFILAPFINDNGENNNPVVLDAQDINPDGSRRIKPTDNPIKQIKPVGESAIASGEETSGAENTNSKRGVKITDKIPAPKNHNDAVAFEGDNKPGIESTGRKNKLRIKATEISQKDAVVFNSNKKNTHGTTNPRSNIADKGAVRNNNSEANNKTVNSKGKITAGTQEESIAALPGRTQDNIQNSDRVKGIEPNTPSNNPQVVIPDAINKNDAVAEIKTTVDSATTISPENELEKLLQEKLKGEDKEKTEVAEASEKNKWNIKPQMAPLFFNTASEGSPIDSNLAANSKDFDNDLSYGVGLNYAISDRISIRSGINTVNMKYSTNNVEYYAALGDATASTGVVSSGGGPNSSLVVGSPAGSPAGTGEIIDEFRSEKLNGSLVQKMGFVEVPLEMSYKLVNRKFGIDLIGGVSTLFLNDNNVTLLSKEGFSSDMGEARNINNISFTTNVGIGFKYRFFEAFEASFEPMFKYQLNTFSSNDGNFKPYFIGLYSGVSFSF